MSQLLVLVNAFYRVSHVTRTIQSILQSQVSNKIDLVVLENPSSKTPDMARAIAAIPNVLAHLVSPANVGNEIFGLFLSQHADIVSRYEYIAFSEGDAVLEPLALRECLRILTKKMSHVACGVGIRSDLPKYAPIRDALASRPDHCTQVVPELPQCINRSGFRFHIFKRPAAITFSRRPPLFPDEGIWSEINLTRFCQAEQVVVMATRDHKCDHIGCELHLPGEADALARYVAEKGTRVRHCSGPPPQLTRIFWKVPPAVLNLPPRVKGRIY